MARHEKPASTDEPVDAVLGSTPAPAPEGVAEAPAQPPAPPEPVLSPTRASATWTAVAVSLLALVVVLVFILQNLQEARVHFFTLTWRLPVGLDLLFAAVLGGLVVLAAGSARVLQLRRLARRQARARRAALARGERG